MERYNEYHEQMQQKKNLFDVLDVEVKKGIRMNDEPQLNYSFKYLKTHKTQSGTKLWGKASKKYMIQSMAIE